MLIDVKMIEAKEAGGGDRNIKKPIEGVGAKELIEEAVKKRDAETLKEMIKDGIISMEDVEEAINNEEQKYHANFDEFRFSIDVLDNELKSLNKLKRKIREEEE